MSANPGNPGSGVGPSGRRVARTGFPTRDDASVAPIPSLRGRLLVATPTLLDPHFLRTVVLVLEHTPSGALGVVLNRPSVTPVGELLGRWHHVAADPAVIFLGGPVAADGAIALARSPAADVAGGVEGFTPVLGDVGALDLEGTPADFGAELEGVRVFVGHAGWGPGQLDHEIGEGAWFAVDAEPADVTTDEPDLLWRVVVARQPGRLRLFTHAPIDPTVN